MSFISTYIGHCISWLKNTAVNRVAKYTTYTPPIFKAERDNFPREKPKDKNEHVPACLGYMRQ